MASSTALAAPMLRQRTVLGRWPTAVALVLAPLLIAVSDAAYALATASGGSDTTGLDAVALMQAHPGQMMWATQAALLACLCMVPAAFSSGQMALSRAPKLAATGGWIMGLGYIAYFGVVSTTLIELVFVGQGDAPDSLAAAIDAAQASPAAVWIFGLFVVGNLVGTPLLGAALWRAKVIPVWAACLIMAWPAFHITGLTVGVEWFEVTGALCMAVGFSQVARKVMGHSQ